MKSRFMSLTFGNVLQLVGMTVIGLLFIFSSNAVSNENRDDIQDVKMDVSAIQEDNLRQDKELEELRDVDIKREGEVKNIKGDLVYHTDILEAMAQEMGVPLPIKRPVE